MGVVPLLIHLELKKTDAKWKHGTCPLKPERMNRTNAWKILYSAHHNPIKYMKPVIPKTTQDERREVNSETSEAIDTDTNEIHITKKTQYTETQKKKTRHHTSAKCKIKPNPRNNTTWNNHTSGNL